LNDTELGESYDRVPYPSVPVPQSHPHRLHAIARLHGLSPPVTSGAQILELGCAAGGNLIPLARELAGSSFTGVDLSQTQIRAAELAAAGEKVANARFIAADVRDFAADNEVEFDYVIAHGLYSWVPPDVQAALLPAIAGFLAPRGIAFVSYNAYPGWHQREVVRELMLRATHNIEEPGQKAAQARALLDILIRTREGENDAYAAALREEREKAAALSDAYLLHDLLEVHNHPCYVGDFLARAEASGLAYVAEANLGATRSELYPPAVRQVLETLPDRVAREQFIDFWRNRSFRETLLCHADQPVAEALDWTAVETMRVGTVLRPLSGVDGRAGERFFASADGNNRIGILNRAAIAALDLVVAAAPGTVAFRDLLLAVGDVDAIRGLISDLFLRNLLTLSPEDGLDESGDSQ
jgi:SAM-dependent methyltransferase